MLSSKAEIAGIKIILIEESYTSKANFIDDDTIPVYKTGEKNQSRFSGKRVKRGLYRTGCGRLVNADVNASLNPMREKPVRWAGLPTVTQLAWCCSSPSSGNTGKIKVCHI